MDGRTPPRTRTYSLSDIELSSQEEHTQKEITDMEQPLERKRMDQDREKEPLVCSGEGEMHKRIIDNLLNQISELGLVLKGMYKPKQEVKDIASKLALHAEQLQSENQTKWLEWAMNADKKEELCHTWADERTALKIQIEELKEKCDIDKEKCEKCKKTKRGNDARDVLIREQSYEAFQQIQEEEWGEEMFSKVETVEGYLWEAPSDFEIVLPCNKYIKSSDKSVITAINWFGGRDGLEKQEKKPGEVAAMIHTLGFPGKEGDFLDMTRRIHYPIISNGDTGEEPKDRTLFTVMQEIRNSVAKRSSVAKLAIPELEGISGVMWARIVAYLFADGNTMVKMYKSNTEVQKKWGAKAAVPKTSANKAIAEEKKQKRSNQDALLISMEGKTYADLLRTVREKINPSSIGVDVKDIYKTKKGDLLLTVSNGTDKAEVLRKEIGEKLPMARAECLIQKRVLHIKGMDQVTTAEEIKDTICRMTSIGPHDLEVKALRPAYGNRQNATLVIPEKQAEQLVEHRRVRIGWTQCRIVERTGDTRCYRCWGSGHKRSECKGPDRGDLCLRCAKEGHRAVDCKNQPCCVNCHQEGHQTGSQRCKTNENKRRTEALEETNNTKIQDPPNQYE